MDAMHFDQLVSIWVSRSSRRRAALGVIAGAAGVLGLASAGETKNKRRRKKRCKPRPVQAVCQSNKQCCPKKTGRVCASNAKDLNCNQTSNVCCLPEGPLGCNDDCDCCGGPVVLCDEGPGRCTAL
jgi:hypothetical protein